MKKPRPRRMTSSKPQIKGRKGSRARERKPFLPVRVESRWGPPIRVGQFAARQCLGSGPDSTPNHDCGKSFLGVSDMAQLDYCEIKATISQMETQGGYLTAAGVDDWSGGIKRSSRPALTGDERRELSEAAAEWTAGEQAGEAGAHIGRGRVAHHLEPELQGTSTERRHFDCGEFLLIGVPDAIKGDTVIEYVSSRNPYLAVGGKRLQANVYALLWDTPKYRVVAADPVSGRRRVLDGAPDVSLAEATMERAWALLSGQQTPRQPDSPRKCIPCVYRSECPFPAHGRVPSLKEMEGIAGPIPWSVQRIQAGVRPKPRREAREATRKA